VVYSIIKTETVASAKRSLDVRLNQRVSEDVLRAIALELKGQDATRYDRTFILYYLPDMEVGAGAWASTHFNPNLEVRILGLSPEQMASLQSETVDSSRDVLGSWLDETIGLSCRITIYRENEKTYCEEKFKDGSSAVGELIEKVVAGGQRFVKKNPVNPRAAEESGDHWLLDRTGHLQIRDNEGLIRTAKKLP
jgi:hypothetical protein